MRSPRTPPRLLAAALAAALALPLPPAAAQSVRLPELGDSASEGLTPGAERRLGEQVMREVRRDPAYLDDPLLLEYVQALWAPLVRAAQRRGDIGSDLAGLFAWEVFLVQDRSVNAFALPGGHVGVYLGLVAMTASRDELASVLAHELSHVTQRHIARSMAAASRQSTVGMLAMILGILAASRSNNTDALQATIAGGQAVMAQGQLNFSRDMEREADRTGYGIYADAGYTPAGVAAMFEKLDAANRLNDSGAFPYLRSHPLTVERVAEARSRLQTTGQAAAGPQGQQGPSEGRLTKGSAAHEDGGPPTALTHALMQARARVLMDPSAQALRRHLDPPAPSATALERVTAYYAAALAASRLNEHTTARAALDKLEGAFAAAGKVIASARPVAPQAPTAADVDGLSLRTLAVLRSDVLLAAGNASAAWAALQDLPASASHVPLPPLRRLAQGALGVASASSAAADAGSATAPADGTAPSRALMLQRAETVLRLSPAPREAVNDLNGQLQSWVAEHRQDAAAWSLLARTSEALGLRLRALRAQAEVRAAQGDLGADIDRLRSAQATSRTAAGADFIEASVIDARLRELLQQRRQLAAELRGNRRPGDGEEPPGR